MSEKLMRGDPMPFYSQMRKRCINSKEFSDIQFLIGPKREPIYAHRAILSARSEVCSMKLITRFFNRSITRILLR